MNENCLILTNNVLYAPEWDETNAEHKFLTERFCGTVVHSIHDMEYIACKRKCIVYLTGTIEGATQALVQDNAGADNLLFCVVREYARCYDDLLALKHGNVRLVSKGKLPTNVFNVGVLFPRFFDDNHFQSIAAEHNFQELTESNKDGVALRKGIYLSQVSAEEDGSRSFHLLRCSSNLQGPTDNFRATDHAILDEVNEVAPYFYEWPAKLNHVLAQIYYNRGSVVGQAAKESKAAIKRHSDKTKDMPVNGMIAFATFYDFGQLKMGRPVPGHGNANDDQYDVCYQSGKSGSLPKATTSMLTQLEFVLKDPHAHPHMHPKFRIRLYPNSLLLISLETNRLYTHEIKPSVLPVNKIPTRLGYVMRCSKTKAVFRPNHNSPGDLQPSEPTQGDGQTYIVEANGEQPLHPVSVEEMQLIKDLYFAENTTDQRVVYPAIYSSLNSGDYKRPLL